MRVLMLFATVEECQGVKNLLVKSTPLIEENSFFSFKNLNIDLLISGIGMLATCYELTRKITTTKYDLIINAGIAGAFDHSVKIGSVFLVNKDRIADLGVEDANGDFFDVFDTGLALADKKPFVDGWLFADTKAFHLDKFNHCTGVTVNKVTGSNSSIKSIQEKYHPDIESMEGAACFYVAKMNNIPCLQLRAISNHVEPRDKSKWDIPKALKSLEVACFDIFEALNIQK